MKAVTAIFNGRQALLGAFVAMALCIPFIYNNCSQARFGTLDSNNGAVIAVGQNTCGDNQVAVGTDLDGVVLCADLTQAAGALCPAGSTLYEFDAANNVAHCLDNCQFPPDPNHVLCSNGTNLSSIGANNAIVCQAHPGATGISCSDTAAYLQGVDTDGSAVCEQIVACPGVTPPTTPTINTVCPIPQELVDIVTASNGDVTPTCADIDLSATDSLTCPAGQALVGVDASDAAVCQELMAPNTADITCGAGEFLISASLCAALPVTDISHICPAGMYLVNTVGNTVNCEALPNATDDFNGTCPAGEYVSGYASGEPVCSAAPVANNLGGFCPTGFYPNAINNNSLVCLPFESYTPGCANGPQQICHVGSSTGEPQTGTGIQLCDNNTNQYGNCEADPGSGILNCFNGYEQNGIQYCDAVDPNSCDPSTFQAVLCPAENGVGQVTCVDGSQTPCTIASCNSGYLLNAAGTVCEPTECVPASVSACTIANGTGSSTCSASGTPGACVLVSCNPGYTANAAGTACVDSEDPVASFSSTPSNPTTDTNGNASFNLSDNVGIKDYRYQLPGAAWTAFTAVSGNPTTYSGSISSSNLSPGTNKISVEVRDTGNKNSIATYQWRVQLCSPNSVMSPSTCTIANATTTSQTCNSAGSAYGACTVVTCGTSGGVVYAPNSTNTACVASSCSTPGHTNVNGVCGDNQNPVASFSSTPSNPSSATSGTVGFNVTDNVAVKDYRVKLPGQAWTGWSAVAGSPQSYAGSVNVSNLSPGTHTIIVRARDTSNKTHDATYTWTIQACSPNSVLSPSTCTIANATATAQTCDAAGSAYGSCKVVSCTSGFSVNAAKTSCTDNQKPVATFTSTPPNPTTAVNAALGFKGSDNVAIKDYRTKLPGAAWSAWKSVAGNPKNFTSSVNASNLSVGTHKAFLHVRDTSGKVGLASYTWVIRECNPGSAAVTCSPGLANASGTKTCSASGSYGACTPSCNAGYLMVGGSCQKIVCGQNGSTTQSCSGPINNASYSQTCNSNGTAFGSCNFVSCNSGFVKVGNKCLAKVCTANSKTSNGCSAPAYGVSTRVCNSTGTAYGSCSLKCNTGYNNVGGKCLKACGSNEVAVGNKSCSCKSGYARGAGNICLPVKCDTGKTNPQSCATPSSDANSVYGFTCSANGTVKGSCQYISCKAGYKRSGNKCISTCNAYQKLVGGKCVDRYVWVNTRSGAKAGISGSRSGNMGSQSKICTLYGYGTPSAAVNKLYGMCASGENKPNKGGNRHLIRYTDKYNNSYNGGGNFSNYDDDSWRCYKHNQKRDDDRSDKLDAYLCDTIGNTTPASTTCKPYATRSCTVGRIGTGYQMCNATGSAYGACTTTACASGFSLRNGVCTAVATPEVAGACLYQHAGYGGVKQCYTSKAAFHTTFLQDKSSSIKVSSGYKVRLYQHYNYSGLTLDVGAGQSVNNFVTKGRNDLFSSICVVPASGSLSSCTASTVAPSGNGVWVTANGTSYESSCAARGYGTYARGAEVQVCTSQETQKGGNYGGQRGLSYLGNSPTGKYCYDGFKHKPHWHIQKKDNDSTDRALAYRCDDTKSPSTGGTTGGGTGTTGGGSGSGGGHIGGVNNYQNINLK